jgi:hypothetical protein
MSDPHEVSYKLYHLNNTIHTDACRFACHPKAVRLGWTARQPFRLRYCKLCRPLKVVTWVSPQVSTPRG